MSYFNKTKPSAFSNADLAPFLRQNQIQRLAVTGFTLDNGIRKTVADAAKIGIETVILKDVVVARNSTTFQMVLPQFAQVSRMADFLAAD
ncbi:hypothetical protein [Lactobacillus paracollinoides] [Lactiplantibacillus mudanjiangensis]|uniref:isochorismatase family protein n=1 Tax=Lactiplantibacillus mudanjiangensis TaxID=1296538 RepID=UPI001015945B|nr:isochorismatase family protein [Lactiplantibacillus mudanjiangensis]VDG32600.1 hypothetical protein [Lactobacillus paracollinoides] [Lactiplantibacillus mudanjiangensis]